MDATTALFTSLGVVFLAISWLVLLINTYRDDFSWGLCSTFLPPLSYMYGLLRFDVAKDPILLAVIGCALLLIGLA